jgi:hypothetical protein
MGLLPRAVRPALGVVVVLTLISLPTLRTQRIPGSALSPTVAWAGGSPDETLNPPAVPPKKSSAMRLGTTQVGAPVQSSMRKFTALERWEIYYRVFRIFVHRI